MAKKKQTRNSSQNSQSHQSEPQPSTSSGTNHYQQLIKDIVQSKSLHELLAEMISTCIASLQTSLSNLSEKIADMEAIISSQQNSINKLQAIADDLKSMPNRDTSVNEYNETLSLRIHGIDSVKSSDICENISTMVSSRMGIPCLPSQFTRVETGAHDDESSQTSTNTRRRVYTIRIENQSLWHQIYRARTMLKGTFIFISEVLSSSDQFLFFLSRKMKKDNRIAATWSYKGNIYIRTLQGDIKHIRSPSDLATY